LQSLIDRYPLYSKADETLYLLGQSYEGEIASIRKMDGTERQLQHQGKVNEARVKADELARERMISDFSTKAGEAYAKVLTRYPVMDRTDDAKARLLALHQPVPRPTKADLARNKAEEASRGEQTMLSRAMGMVGRHPDVSPAARVGDPTLEDKTPLSASTLVQQANKVAMGTKPSDSNTASVQTTGNGAPPENQPAPRSDTPPQPEAANVADPNPAATPDPNELKAGAGSDSADPKVATAPDPNELKPNVEPQPAAAPAQVNEIQTGASAQAQPNGKASASDQELADDNAIASSKRKKKKGLLKVIPLK
jgi:hypothetical protein